MQNKLSSSQSNDHQEEQRLNQLPTQDHPLSINKEKQGEWSLPQEFKNKSESKALILQEKKASNLLSCSKESKRERRKKGEETGKGLGYANTHNTFNPRLKKAKRKRASQKALACLE